MHREMEGRVIKVDGPKERAYFDFSIQFFVYFPVQSLLWRLAGFYLTAGKLPPVFPFAISSLRSKDSPLLIKDYRSNYLYRLHI